MSQSVLISNPLRRLRKTCNYTIEEVAELVGVSSKSIYLSELGVYELPLEVLCNLYVSRVSNETTQNIHNEYQTFRREHRQMYANSIPRTSWRFTIKFEDVKTFRTSFNTKMAPIQDFRVNVLKQTSYAFTKNFLINPGLLDRLEKGKEFKKVPAPISAALTQCGATKNFMDELNVRTKLFFSSN